MAAFLTQGNKSNNPPSKGGVKVKVEGAKPPPAAKNPDDGEIITPKAAAPADPAPTTSAPTPPPQPTPNAPETPSRKEHSQRLAPHTNTPPPKT